MNEALFVPRLSKCVSSGQMLCRLADETEQNLEFAHAGKQRGTSDWPCLQGPVIRNRITASICLEDCSFFSHTRGPSGRLSKCVWGWVSLSRKKHRKILLSVKTQIYSDVCRITQDFASYLLFHHRLDSSLSNLVPGESVVVMELFTTKQLGSANSSLRPSSITDPSVPGFGRR